MKNFLKNKMLSKTLLSLSLSLVMIGGVFVYKAMAVVSAVDLTSPTAASKTYVQSGGSVSVGFTVTTDAIGDGTFQIEIYSGDTVIGDTLTTAQTYSVNGANPLTKSVEINKDAVPGSYDVKVTVQQPGDGTVVTDTEVGAVVVVQNCDPSRNFMIVILP